MIRISVTNPENGNRADFEIGEESDIYECVDVFKAALLFQSFAMKTVDKVNVAEDEE